MNHNEAIERMRSYPGGSYMRCPFCVCKSRTHDADCPIEIVAASIEATRRFLWIHEHGDMGSTDDEEKQKAWHALKELFGGIPL